MSSFLSNLSHLENLSLDPNNAANYIIRRHGPFQIAKSRISSILSDAGWSFETGLLCEGCVLARDGTCGDCIGTLGATGDFCYMRRMFFLHDAKGQAMVNSVYDLIVENARSSLVDAGFGSV